MCQGHDRRLLFPTGNGPSISYPVVQDFTSNASGFQQMHRWISRQRHQSTALHLLMEATGVYYEELAYFLQENGYRVCVLLPNKSSAFAKSLDYKSKTDKVDAKSWLRCRWNGICPSGHHLVR
ncbi:MAG: transposase [Lewinellaceae bacterium]|nr:transposase [Lewinellaceae bacterium]